ncbi:MAG TPA: tetratricopeptide repeat protein [Tepidisphaeraceae bacterium]|nr:tetratricopeptide repeat protein [Tepidisphaeraceae bacterium]
MQTDRPATNFSADPLEAGLAHHRAGRLAEAANVYQQILARQPNHPGALHLLGVVESQCGRHAPAVELIRRAIAVNPKAEDFHSNLGLALAGLGKHDEAIAEFKTAISMRPNHPEALANMSDSMAASGDVDSAIAALRQAVTVRRDFPEAHFKLGNALGRKGQVEEAIASYRQAINIRPNYVECLNNLGSALRMSGRTDEAIILLRRAAIIRPDFHVVLVNLGGALLIRGQLSEALAVLQRATEMRPDVPEAWNHLGNTLYARGDYPGAVAAHRRGIALRADWAEAHINLGNALRHADQFDAAIESFALALKLQPNNTDGLNSLGNTFKDIARLDEAMDRYHRVVEISPHHIMSDSNYVFTMRFHPAYDDARILTEQRLWSQRQVTPLNLTIAPHENDRAASRRLRIGYISPTFRQHCQSLFTIPLLRNHDHQKFEIFCYADGGVLDPITNLLRSFADTWRPVAGMSDDALGELIRSDKIDILVDLTMHMAEGRPLLMAKKPAPVQVAWLAYPGTTGLEAMDYRFTDPYLDPPGARDGFYSEKSIRLPDSFWCFDPVSSDRALYAQADPRGEPGPLPALRNGYITFGSLNNFTKLNDGVLALWARTIKSVDQSRLLVLAPDGSARRWLLERLSAGGVESGRVEFVNRQARRLYLRQYQRIDLCLDTLPANGHTTSLDSYWMGVPVVTLIGPTVEGRAGWSHLSNLRLTELAATKEDEFVKIAAELAGDLDRLAEIRRTLRQRMIDSPLMDGPRFARGVEAAFGNMWDDYCKGQSA